MSISNKVKVKVGFSEFHQGSVSSGSSGSGSDSRDAEEAFAFTSARIFNLQNLSELMGPDGAVFHAGGWTLVGPMMLRMLLKFPEFGTEIEALEVQLTRLYLTVWKALQARPRGHGCYVLALIHKRDVRKFIEGRFLPALKLVKEGTYGHYDTFDTDTFVEVRFRFEVEDPRRPEVNPAFDVPVPYDARTMLGNAADAAQIMRVLAKVYASVPGVEELCARGVVFSLPDADVKLEQEEICLALGTCLVCHRGMLKRRFCKGCRRACYCSLECQTTDWPQHARLCRSMTLEDSRGLI